MKELGAGLALHALRTTCVSQVLSKMTVDCMHVASEGSLLDSCGAAGLSSSQDMGLVQNKKAYWQRQYN